MTKNMSLIRAYSYNLTQKSPASNQKPWRMKKENKSQKTQCSLATGVPLTGTLPFAWGVKVFHKDVERAALTMWAPGRQTLCVLNPSPLENANR